MKKNKDRDAIMGGMVWKFAERISSQGMSFVLSVILARLLMPAEYGLIAMINVLIIFANVFVTSGFTASLIQKKNADELDFSTIFYCTLTLSVILYCIIYLGAPYVATFYNMPDLTILTRVYSLSLIITSYQTIQQAYISRHMLFKKTFFATFLGTLMSGIVGIIMAYQGYGVWALVAQYISNIIINMLVLMSIIPWRPRLIFSWSRAKELMNYGSKILLSNLVSTIYKEIRQLVIGKFYTPSDLAMYNRGAHMPHLVTNNLDSTIKSVLFPAMSNHSDDPERVKQLLKRSLKTTAYISFFFLTMMAVASKPLIRVLLTDKWIDCVPYMQILCFSNMIVTLSGANIEALKAIGKSNEVLKLEVFKKPLFLIVVLLSVKISVMAVVLTMPLNAIFALFLNMGPTKKYFNYNRKEQMMDLLPYFVLVAIIVLCTLPLTLLHWNDFVIMGLQLVLGTFVYISTSIIFKLESYTYCKKIVVDFYSKKYGKR